MQFHAGDTICVFVMFESCVSLYFPPFSCVGIACLQQSKNADNSRDSSSSRLPLGGCSSQLSARSYRANKTHTWRSIVILRIIVVRGCNFIRALLCVLFAKLFTVSSSQLLRPPPRPLASLSPLCRLSVGFRRARLYASPAGYRHFFQPRHALSELVASLRTRVPHMI